VGRPLSLALLIALPVTLSAQESGGQEDNSPRTCMTHSMSIYSKICPFSASGFSSRCAVMAREEQHGMTTLKLVCHRRLRQETQDVDLKN
jgi:hypothetical protein